MRKQSIFSSERSTIKKLFFIVALLGVVIVTKAQTISGTVTTPDGETVIGASVLIDGTTNGTITDMNGKYVLQDVAENATLVFSYIGLQTERVPVNGRKVINVIMEESSILMEETVVIGYGTVKKSDLTGAVSVIKTDDFKNRAVTSIGDALQGSASGVTVRSSGGLGDLPTIQIRGTGNLTNNDPLYVIDGIPTDNNVGFNTNDIETIQILKDASAAAIYGSRAANGVVIITTKSGQEGKAKIQFNAQLALQNMNKLEFVNGDEWRKIMSAVFQRGLDRGISTNPVPDWYTANTDWQDEFMKTGVLQEYNLAFSGGNKDSKYRVSFGHMDNSGYTIGHNFKRFTMSVTSQFKRGIFTFGESLQLGKTNMKGHARVALNEVVNMIPIIPVHDDVNGKNGWGIGNALRAYTNAYNVVAQADDRNGYSKDEYLYARASGWAEVRLLPFLTYKLNLGATISDSDSHNWETGYQYAHGFTDVASNANANGSRHHTYLIENTLTLDKVLGKHHITALLGQSYQDSNSRTLGSGTKDLVASASGIYLQNVSGGATLVSATGTSSQHRMISYFSRLNYDFEGRYLLQATVRRDGTSRFAQNSRWGTFPSVSLAWRISNEPFYNLPWLDDLKLRANYGTLGSQNVGNYDYQNLIYSYAGYAFQGGLNMTNGQAIVQIANENISWEKKETINIGMDMAFLNNRLQTSLEYYIAKSKDVLYAQSIMKTVGSTSNPVVNSASIENKGFEMSLNWRDKINKDWSYNINLNLSQNKNKLTGLGYGVDSYDATTTLSKVGKPIGLFYLLKTDGLYQTDEEALRDNKINGAKAGDVKYIDADNSGTITLDDRQLLTDKSPWPKLEASLNITVNYKKWSAQIFGFGQFFKWVYNSTLQNTNSLSNQSQITKDYANNMWSESNKHNNAKYPRTAWTYTMNDIGYSDRWLERGDFFKFSTLSIGYNYVPVGAFAKVFSDVQITLTAQNFLCLSAFSGYDPDFTAGLFTPGNSSLTHANGSPRNPNPRSFILGVNLNF